MSNSRHSKNSSNNLKSNNNKKYSENYIKHNYYNNTSEAFKYAPNYEPEYNPVPKRRVRKKIKEKYVKAEQNERYLSLKFFVGLAIFATIGICVVGINAKTIEKRFKIDSLNSELKEIRELNKNLQTDIAKNLDLDYIQKYATENLRMQKPSSHQIVHISVPKESYTVKNNKLNIDEDGFFKKFDIFKIFK